MEEKYFLIKIVIGLYSIGVKIDNNS